MDGDQTARQEDSALRGFERDRAIASLRSLAHGEPLHVVPGPGIDIGRRSEGSSVGVQIDDGLASRVHARIERGLDAWYLADRGSRNGAFVDGRAVSTNERAPLLDGSVIRIGDTLFVFRIGEPSEVGDPRAPAFPGLSPLAVAVRKRIALVAAASGHALVLGETGTGKERVARALARANGPFVPKNCAELKRELATSELFGHVRGAFSGATQNKPGIVELAHDGTLFLDEIGELALDVQADFLRFLEDGSYRPVGGTELKHSTARVIAATNVDIDAAVARGDFRRDLAARLRASNRPLELPSLRERREDIPSWIRMFLDEVGHTEVTPWSAGALECLLLFPWLENLRELRGLVRSLVADDPAMPWSAERLPAKIRAHRNTLRGHSEQRRDVVAPPREPTVDEIKEALARTSGRMRTAAIQLGIDRRKLYRLCERFGIALEAHRGQSQEEDE